MQKHMDFDEEELAHIKEIENFERYEWFVEVVRNRIGDSFGELAL